MCKERKLKLGKVGKGSVAELDTKPQRNCNFKYWNGLTVPK